MSIIDDLTRQAGRIANDVQASLKRARVEGERRLLQRQHRAALEELGERAFELVKAGALPGEALSAEVAAVESKLMEIEAKAVEIEGMRDADDVGPEWSGAAPPADSDPSRTAFPMVGDAPAAKESDGPGPGWEAAERFFAKE